MVHTDLIIYSQEEELMEDCGLLMVMCGMEEMDLKRVPDWDSDLFLTNITLEYGTTIIEIYNSFVYCGFNVMCFSSHSKTYKIPKEKPA